VKQTEIFDTKYDVKWNSTSWGEEGGVTINGIPFVIQFIKTTKIPNIEPNNNIWEVSFHRADKGVEKYDIQHTTDVAFAIYGVVFNSIIAKKSLFDGVYFTSVMSGDTQREHEQRTRVYWGIAKKLERYGRMHMYINEHPNQTQWLFTHSPLEKWGNNWKSPKQQMEHLDFTGNIIR
jgi:hypothetical protein